MRSKRFSLVFLLLVYSAFALFTGIRSRGQEAVAKPQQPSQKPLRSLPDRSGNGWNAAANRWQLSAVDVKSQTDSVSSSERAARNAFWYQPLKSFYDLSKTGVGIGEGTGDPGVGSNPEIPDLPDTIWVTATFTNFHVFDVDPKYHLIYTELDLKVDQVIRAPKSYGIGSGSLIQTTIQGGKIKTSDGTVVSSRLYPKTNDYQVGHRYLLLLTKASNQNWYFTDARWDISSGSVMPDTNGEIDRARRGESILAGMTTEGALAYLRSTLRPFNAEEDGGK